MPGRDNLRYIIYMKPQAPTGDEMHIIYQCKSWLIEGHNDYKGPPKGQWEALVRSGPWWDGTKPLFVYMEPQWIPLSHDEVLDTLGWWYGLQNIGISWTMKEWPDIGGCAVWVQGADTSSHQWRVWHSPKDKSNVLSTAPTDWKDWGWYSDVTSAPVNKPNIMKFMDKGKPKAADKAKAEEEAGQLTLYLFLQVWPILSRWIAENREASISLRPAQQDSIWNNVWEEEAALWEDAVFWDDFFDSLIQEDREGSHDVEDGSAAQMNVVSDECPLM